ncbi:MAG: glycosyltransferase family 39 protein [Chloroflexia bacterium]|nr:glycosyltransferase family 39 protein [Chloroflexia bacterium]
MEQKPPTSELELPPQDRRILLGLIWLLGALVRFFPLFQFPQATLRPFGMGGLYLLFAQEILRRGWALPQHIPYYTLEGLPYAYPPLAFYLEALLLHCFSPPRFVLVNVLPALFSVLTVGAFFLLARQFFDGRKALLSTAIYALLPAAFLEHLPGEGLVEGLGTLCFILGIIAFLRLSRHPSGSNILLLGGAIALNLLASPGGAYGLAMSLGLLWLLRAGGRRLAFWRLLLAGGVGLLFSAPYWLTVSLEHGPAIFLRTFFRQHADLGALLLAKMGLLVEQQLPLSPWGILALIGLAALLARRAYVLPLWTLFLYVIPREFSYLVAVPLALLAGAGLLDVVLAGAEAEPLARRGPGRPLLVGLLLLVLFGWGIVRAFAWGMHLSVQEDMVSVDELAAMAWIQEHTPPEASFLVMGDEIEWFPLLTERNTLNVIWGSEWAEDDSVFALDRELQECPTPDCYLTVAGGYGLQPTYLYLSNAPDYQAEAALAAQSEQLEFVWANEGASLYRWP